MRFVFETQALRVRDYFYGVGSLESSKALKSHEGDSQDNRKAISTNKNQWTNGATVDLAMRFDAVRLAFEVMRDFSPFSVLVDLSDVSPAQWDGDQVIPGIVAVSEAQLVILGSCKCRHFVLKDI